jgi:hypothetical protein
VIGASPPCTAFSVAAISRNWKKFGPRRIPISKGALDGMEIVRRTLAIIRELEPTYYFIENPRGMLRMMNFMQGWNRSTVTYCQYGLGYQKPTDIWNNCMAWKPRPVCKPRSPCHEIASRGGKTGLQGVQGGAHGQVRAWGNMTAIKRGIVPRELCEEIIIACERGLEEGHDRG